MSFTADMNFIVTASKKKIQSALQIEQDDCTIMQRTLRMETQMFESHQFVRGFMQTRQLDEEEQLNLETLSTCGF